MTETDQVLTYRKDGDIAVISMNRPEKRNALNRALSRALLEALETADQDRDVTVIVLRGEGKSFCAGHDVERNDPEREKDRHHAIHTHQRLSRGLRLATAIWELHTPIIASVRGHALGEGCVMTMLCDLTIAAEDALFGEPEIRFAGPATAMMMPWVIGLKRARELIYMGDMIGAAEAREIGMVNRVVPTDQLEEATLKYARRSGPDRPRKRYSAPAPASTGFSRPRASAWRSTAPSISSRRPTPPSRRCTATFRPRSTSSDWPERSNGAGTSSRNDE